MARGILPKTQKRSNAPRAGHAFATNPLLSPWVALGLPGGRPLGMAADTRIIFKISYLLQVTSVHIPKIKLRYKSRPCTLDRRGFEVSKEKESFKEATEGECICRNDLQDLE